MILKAHLKLTADVIFMTDDQASGVNEGGGLVPSFIPRHNEGVVEEKGSPCVEGNWVGSPIGEVSAF